MAADVLAEIKLLTSRGDIRYSPHALERMSERGFTTDDAECGLLSATAATPQPNDRYQVTGGKDTDGMGVTIIVVLEANVVVVTIYPTKS